METNFDIDQITAELSAIAKQIDDECFRREELGEHKGEGTNAYQLLEAALVDLRHARMKLRESRKGN